MTLKYAAIVNKKIKKDKANAKESCDMH